MLKEIPMIVDAGQELEEALRAFMCGQEQHKRFMLIRRQPRRQLAAPLITVLHPLLFNQSIDPTNPAQYRAPVLHCSRFQSETALLNETCREMTGATAEFARHVSLEAGVPQKVLRVGDRPDHDATPVVIYNRLWCRKSGDELGEFFAIANAYVEAGNDTQTIAIKVIFIMESIGESILVGADDDKRSDWFLYQPTKGLRGMKLSDILPTNDK